MINEVTFYLKKFSRYKMDTIISEEQKEKYFRNIFLYLNNKRNRSEVLLTKEWTYNFPKEAGVYLFFEDGDLKYVGETGKLQGRIKDLLNTKHHTLRRSVGEAKFKSHKGYTKADSRNSYGKVIEQKLNKCFKEHFTISYYPILIGRKEFEEWIFDKHPKVIFYNKRKKRK